MFMRLTCILNLLCFVQGFLLKKETTSNNIPRLICTSQFPDLKKLLFKYPVAIFSNELN